MHVNGDNNLHNLRTSAAGAAIADFPPTPRSVAGAAVTPPRRAAAGPGTASRSKSSSSRRTFIFSSASSPSLSDPGSSPGLFPSSPSLLKSLRSCQTVPQI
ncbi:hypothetical protein BD410DRAFT_795466 [Rickenella mellea]|uniref:Uncharacterized protein n=1 Tax=Rickenella mellea TaxID=50990 RepID=A0A4Y7PP44_9AGAM|nr:hypothetical protein BD410DRAFT_795466 [Rickenella mellea]